jgi:putative ABC transport system permease protein
LTKEENGGGGLSTEIWPIDEDYLNTMGMSLSRGRNFSIQIPTDSSALIINEAAAKSLGYFQDPLDKLVYYQHDKTYHIIGVVKDFNFSSLRENITPLVMMLGNNADAMSIRVHSDHLPDLLARMENKWRELSNNQPFAYSFMDEDFDAIYGTEQRMGSIFFIFTGMAVLIACLGLLGLAAYAAEQRNKEISIRKILGADISSLVAMLSRDFLKPVVISVVISIPASWYIMQKWLEHFAYRENMPWRMFVLASIGALFTAILTISAQSIKAARVNPVQNLKTE